MRIILCSLLALSLTACMPAAEEVKPGYNSNKPVEDVTDYSICNGNASGNINGSWVNRFKQGDVTITKVLKIGDSKMVLTTECAVRGTSLTLEVSSWITYLNNAITIQSSPFERHKIEKNDYDMTCESAINGGTVNYSFKGRCLVLTNPENKDNKSVWLPR